MEKVSVIPAAQVLDESTLLLDELQLRMTHAVLASADYDRSLHSPHVLYRILAQYFEAQKAEAQHCSSLMLSTLAARRVWAFCFDCVVANAAPTPTPCPLTRFVLESPILPLASLQQPAPVVPTSTPAFPPNPPASSPSTTHEAEQSPCSIFALLRHALSAVMELAYVANQRLHRTTAASSSSSSSLSVLALAALSASLVPTLDRVQATRLTTQLADDALAHWQAGHAAKGGANLRGDESVPLTLMALFVGGVWRVWAALDEAHAAPLRALGDALVAEVAEASRTDGVAGGRAATLTQPFSFVAWLQSALRRDGGRLHKTLYATTQSASDARRSDSATQQERTVGDGEALVTSAQPLAADATDGEGEGEVDRDFWSRLAS